MGEDKKSNEKELAEQVEYSEGYFEKVARETKESGQIIPSIMTGLGCVWVR